MTIPVETLQELERLRARVEELEYELGTLQATADQEIAHIVDYFNLTVTEARVVRALAHAHGAPLSRPVLAEVVANDLENLRSVDSHVKRIRAKNGSNLPIDTIYGLGYRMLPDTAKTVRDVMAGKIQVQRYRSHLYRGAEAAA